MNRSTKRANLLTLALTIAAFASAVFLGCGVKSKPIPPEAARPEKIAGLEAANAKEGIRLTWDRPESYAGGAKMKDLGSFSISRAEEGSPPRRSAKSRCTTKGDSRCKTLLSSSTARP